MRLALLLGAAIAVSAVTSASSAVRIKGDPGGQIGPYLEKMAALRGSGEKVIIDGPCLSACTMVLGAIPRNRICVTPRARLGFHAAWRPGDNGQPVMSKGATQLLMDIYPQHVRSWIATARRPVSAHDVSQRPGARGDVSDLRVNAGPLFVGPLAANASRPPAAATSAIAP